MVRANELKNRAVVSLETAQKIGTIAGLVFDPKAALAVGLRVDSQNHNSGNQNNNAANVKVFVPAAAVYSIGPDAVTVSSAGLGQANIDLDALETMPDSAALIGTKVVTDGGTFLGTISDVLIDETNLQIGGYELGGSLLSGLFGGAKVLPAGPGYRYGGELMLVPDAVAAAVNGGQQPTAQAAQQAVIVNHQAAPPVTSFIPQSGQQPSPQGEVRRVEPSALTEAVQIKPSQPHIDPNQNPRRS